jgi:hypothetical protein
MLSVESFISDPALGWLKQWYLTWGKSTLWDKRKHLTGCVKLKKDIIS